ncbi:MAG: hypothetical protein V2I33_21870 [Kangiellaceae bacterium]|jgi:dynein heavy chain|nr:hypothetical protein [Kangiellaceae bacterium]
MTLQTNVTTILTPEEVTDYPEQGRYVHGLFLEGAAWELGRTAADGYLKEAEPKDIHPRLPVVNVVAIPLDQKPKLGFYPCPVYVTSARGPTFVFEAGMKMENEDELTENFWILRGVALLMSDD